MKNTRLMLCAALVVVGCASETETESEPAPSVEDATVEDATIEDATVEDASADAPSPDLHEVEIVPAPDTESDDLPVEVPDEGGGPETTDVPDTGGGCMDAFPGQVVITEILVLPGKGPAFVEIYNADILALTMTGWVLRDGAGGEAPLSLEAGSGFEGGSYVVFALGDEPQGYDAVVVNGIDLGTSALKVMAGETEVDAVDWSTGEWPAEAGLSMSLDPGALTFLANDDPANWCAAEATPGTTNVACPQGPVCGDGETNDAAEDCDDGKNGDDADGCTDLCTFSCQDPSSDCSEVAGDCAAAACEKTDGGGQVCGQVFDADDAPDDGDVCTDDLCAEGVGPSHPPAQNGTVCDNGAGAAGDYCHTGECVDPECGDNVKGPTEPCEDGNLDPGDGCSPTCQLEECGNLVEDPGEQCDDGKNGDDLDGCKDSCLFTCSVPGVDCEAASGDCQKAVCKAGGLGQVCAQTADESDVPDDSNPCTADLCDGALPSNEALGDGTACDNGAGEAGDYCKGAVCIEAQCGDGIEGPLEACDDGNADPCDGCLPICETHTNECGDTFECGDEGCDDGNKDDGDGCSSTCEIEVVSPCPAEMIHVEPAEGGGVAGPFCVDRYEASRADATAESMGSDTSKAVSKAGVIPWFVNPLLDSHIDEFAAACVASGKRLCAKEEWFYSCAGPEKTTYSWGEGFDPETCNCVDSFCDDYCAEHSIDPCITTMNCGYTLGYAYPVTGFPFHEAPTGSFAACSSAVGAFDINGNVWEVVPSMTDPRGYEVRGGAFNCGAPAARLQCAYNADWNSLFAGFRCCRDPDGGGK